MNVEAAEEVVRQLRMRDIGGIIVIDFIDMARSRNRDMVLKTLRSALDEDRTKTYVVEVSPLGLVEMTRQNVTDGVREILTKRCPTCDGEGVVTRRRPSPSRSSASSRRWSTSSRSPRPTWCGWTRGWPRSCCGRTRAHDLEEETGKRFHFEGGDALSLETFSRRRVGGGARRSRRAPSRSRSARRCW